MSDSPFKDLGPESADQEVLDELMEKDAKSGRELTKFWYWLTSGLGIFMVLFYMYNSGIAPVSTQFHRGIYVLVTFVMVFLTYPMTAKSRIDRPSISDIALALVSIAVVGYWILEFENLNYRMGSETSMDAFVAMVGIVISLEAARRVLGMSMTMAGLGFLAYLLWGNLLEDIPGVQAFAHDGFKFTRAMNFLFYNQDGIFGIMANVLVTYVILFIFFGSFLKYSGASKFFIDLPLALAGKSVGGPAKVAVIASGFFGSVSGSAIANTVSTGAFTIPMMKRAGFRPHVAGAIEPAASIGGMFMPPIMGAGGFLMAEMTEIPYIDIMKMAIFPAVMYFLSVFVMIHFEAKRYGLYGDDDPNAPTAWDILKKEWYLAAPLVIIVVMMLMGRSAGFSAVVAIVSCVVVSWFTPDHKMGWREVRAAMIEGSRNTLIIGATVGVIGIIVGTISLSGIGLKFSDIIISLSGGFLPAAILLIGIASLVLGMGVPVTAAYLITAVLTVGSVSNMIAMQHFGMPLTDMEITRGMAENVTWVMISSHMIVYWFSQDSNITPPVCVAAYAGAAIAGSDPWKTGWTSFKFAKFLYIGPFLFAYSRGFLLNGSPMEIITTFATIALATVAFGSVTMGYLSCGMNVLEWIIMAVATTILFFPDLGHLVLPFDLPSWAIDVLGIALWGTVFLLQKARIAKNPNLTLPAHELKKLRAEMA
ncbi:MAG: TRAP transporter fused permease subunit [Candidatus Krumholzibacteria bacterium]|nr:TRAP transporter fused permease subunit [Candidatus Krumholzibacteria bacterium]